MSFDKIYNLYPTMKNFKFACLTATMAALAFTQTSCNKVNDIKANLLNQKLIYPPNFGLDDFSGTVKYRIYNLENKEKILFGGMDYDKLNALSELSRKNKYPVLIENSNYLTFRKDLKYKNEFYLVDRVVKEDITIMAQDEKGNKKEVFLQAGKTITLIWGSEDGFEGYYKFLVNNNIIDPIEIGEALGYIVFIRNVTDKHYPESPQTEKIAENTQIVSLESVQNQINEGKTKYLPSQILPKEMVGVIEMLKYDGNKNYKVTSKAILETLEETHDLANYSLNVKNFGLFK